LEKTEKKLEIIERRTSKGKKNLRNNLGGKRKNQAKKVRN